MSVSGTGNSAFYSRLWFPIHLGQAHDQIFSQLSALLTSILGLSLSETSIRLKVLWRTKPFPATLRVQYMPNFIYFKLLRNRWTFATIILKTSRWQRAQALKVDEDTIETPTRIRNRARLHHQECYLCIRQWLAASVPEAQALQNTSILRSCLWYLSRGTMVR